MNNIKFRVWHKKLKEMFVVQNIYGLGWPAKLWIDLMNDNHSDYVSALPDEIELMQWTGLQDINGQDLYHGDIIIEDFLNRTGYIAFGEHQTSLDYYASTAYGFYIKFKNDEPQSLPAKYTKLKIISNIYMNPELLEQ